MGFKPQVVMYTFPVNIMSTEFDHLMPRIYTALCFEVSNKFLFFQLRCLLGFHAWRALGVLECSRSDAQVVLCISTPLGMFSFSLKRKFSQKQDGQFHNIHVYQDPCLYWPVSWFLVVLLLALWPHSEKVMGSVLTQAFLCGCSLCACVDSLRVLRLLPAVQRHAR